MARPFNHWFHWQRLAKMPFELPLVMISVMTGYVWFGNDLLLNREHLFLFAMIFGVAILTISFGSALYQGTKNTNDVSVARVVLFLCLTTPAVYGILTLLPSPEFTLEFVQISSMSVGFGILISRVSSTHPASPGLLAKRILVYGPDHVPLKSSAPLRNRISPQQSWASFPPQTKKPPSFLLTRCSRIAPPCARQHSHSKLKRLLSP